MNDLSDEAMFELLPCLTPDAKFTTQINGSVISITIDCGERELVHEAPDAELLESCLHRAIESVLGAFWNRRANRWSAFEPEELKELSRFIEHSRIYDTKTKVEDEIEFEQQRRHATGEGEK
jgi:hypothetical protein